jgi:predicted N-formylglutamate amidohydrolase
MSDAFESVEGRDTAPVFLTCEHASERLPDRWRWPDEDKRLAGTHWAFDLGARELTLELAAAMDSPAVLARFSRLLVDPNREEEHVDLFRAQADGVAVGLNRDLDAGDVRRRVEGYYRPYHAAVDAGLVGSAAPVLLSIHSFTPVYEGHERDVRIGVLFNDDESLARALGAHLEGYFVGVDYNEPWSGRDGLIYAPESHARAHGRKAVELEIRQDLAVDPGFRAQLTASVAGFFSTRSLSE